MTDQPSPQKVRDSLLQAPLTKALRTRVKGALREPLEVVGCEASEHLKRVYATRLSMPSADGVLGADAFLGALYAIPPGRAWIFNARDPEYLFIVIVDKSVSHVACLGIPVDWSTEFWKQDG